MKTGPARILVIVASLITSLIVAIPTQAQTKGCLAGIETDTPTLFVHGFRGKPDDWLGEKSLEQKVHRVKDTNPEEFDYSQYNTRWVTDENIGPKLAQRIACIAQSSREEGGKGKVIVIGHSMGGLAAQFAANQTVNGRRVADDIGLVIAIGTPFNGSQTADWVMTIMRALCMNPHTKSPGLDPSVDPDDCESWLDANTAVGGLRQDSAKLQELPQFPADVPVHTIAGNVLKANFNIFGIELKPLNTDLVVDVASATKS